MNLTQSIYNSLFNINTLDSINTSGTIAQVAGGLITVWGFADLCRSCCQNDPNHRSAMIKSGAMKMAVGVGVFAIGLGLHQLARKVESDFFHTVFSPAKAIDIETGTESTTCNLEALNRLLKANKQPSHQALFRNFTCDNFLPWQNRFAEKMKLGKKEVSNIAAADLKKPIMWLITPSKAPVIAMTDPEKEQLYTLLIERDYYSYSCINGIPMFGGAGENGRTYSYDYNVQLSVEDGQLLNLGFVSRITATCPKVTDLFFSLIPDLEL